jgi:DNA polymerase-1
MILIVDGTGLFARMFFALDKTGVQGIAGFYNQLKYYLDRLNPTQVHICFDNQDSWRKGKFPKYKANRPPKPETYHSQATNLQNILGKSFSVYNYRGYEADDCIKALCEVLPDNILVLTDDKDMCQLVNDRVTLFSKNRTIDSEVVYVRYGLKPEQLIHFQALLGDAVDNIPGCKGIGPVRAKQLIVEFGDIYNIYNNLNRTPHFKVLEECRDTVKLSLEMVTLVTPPGFQVQSGTYDLTKFHQDMVEFFTED